MEKYIITINAETAEDLQKALADLSRTFNFNETFTYKEAAKAVDEPTETIAKEEPAASPTEETFKDVSEDVVSLADAKPIITAFGMKSKENQAFVKKFLDEKGVVRLSDLNDADRTELVKLVSTNA